MKGMEIGGKSGGGGVWKNGLQQASLGRLLVARAGMRRSGSGSSRKVKRTKRARKMTRRGGARVTVGRKE